MATNPALKQLSEFSKGDPELNRRIVQFESNTAEKTKETDRSIQDLQNRFFAGYLETDFIKTSNTTLADVPGLGFEIQVGEVWAVQFALYFTSTTAGGAKFALTAPTNASIMLWGSTSAASGVNDVIGQTTTVGASISLGAAAGTTNVTLLNATIKAGNAKGLVQLRAAQNASNGTPLVITRLSHFRATRVG